MSQAERDLAHARGSAEAEWACFASQQAAEKAVKAVILERGGAGWGHSVLRLMESLPPEVARGDDVLDAARRLDRHYIPARYPSGFDAGKPGDYYTEADKGAAIDAATRTPDRRSGARARPRRRRRRDGS